jgi:hypothetical protein
MSEPTTEDLKRAVKLFNRWQFQEAADAFRQLADESDGRDRAFLDALAHIANGFYRIWRNQGEANATVEYLQKGIDLVRPFDRGALGLSTDGLVQQLEMCLEEARRWRRGESEIFNRDFIPRLEYTVEA